MIRFNDNNFAQNLPDAYKKDGNNNKLLQIVKHSTDMLRRDIQAADDCLDLNKAVGKTLDLYGEVVAQGRRGKTDEQYRIDILAKIMRNISNGTYDSVISAVSFSFGCELSEVEIKEADEPCTIELLAIPLDIIEKNDLSQDDIINIIEQLLPVGVGFKSFLFTGTFEFGNSENEFDENKGFSDDKQITGGYFGNIAR